MDDKVRHVNGEIRKIDQYMELIKSLTVTELGTCCDDNDITIKSGILSEIYLRLFDLKSFYEACTVDVPFPIRNVNQKG